MNIAGLSYTRSMVSKISHQQLTVPGINERYRFTRNEGQEDSPICQVYRHTLTESYPYHWLEYYEIALIVDGECIHAINGQSFEMKPGAIFLLSPADFHTLIIPAGIQVSILGIMFNESVLDDQLRNWLFSKQYFYNLQLNQDQFSFFRESFELILYEVQHPQNGSKRIVNSTLQNLLIRLSRFSSPGQLTNILSDTIPRMYSRSMQNALLYINHHFRQPLTLEHVAAQACLSPNYFSGRFHKLTGVTFKQYIQNLRLRFAAGLLTASDLPITEILFASGFNDGSHFGRVLNKPTRSHRAIIDSKILKIKAFRPNRFAEIRFLLTLKLNLLIIRSYFSRYNLPAFLSLYCCDIMQ